MKDRFFLHDSSDSNEYLSVECSYFNLQDSELHDAIHFETGDKKGNDDSSLGFSHATPYDIFTSTIVSVEDARKFANFILNLCDRIEEVNHNG